uniref:Uncharacterized protein n=1 Tax=Rhizophora mucronata TaxID=61149 RepID=A0A2P2NDI2_RHIMU
MEVHKETNFLGSFCCQMFEIVCPCLEAFQINYCRPH